MTFCISINPEILMLKPRRAIMAQFCTSRLRFSYFLNNIYLYSHKCNTHAMIILKIRFKNREKRENSVKHTNSMAKSTAQDMIIYISNIQAYISLIVIFVGHSVVSAKCRLLLFTADFKVKYQYILFGVNPIEPFLPTIWCCGMATLPNMGGWFGWRDPQRRSTRCQLGRR